MPETITDTKLTKLIIEGIQERKGHNISVVDMTHIAAAPVSRFIIAEGSSNMQVTAIADSVREWVQTHGDTKPFNYDGYNNAEWIVVDYGDTLVHIFQPEARMRYKLEDLWSDAVITEIPDL